jgi:hypothetical protein
MAELETQTTGLATRERSLLATPQRWGVLPTAWFWNRFSNWKHLVPLGAVATAVLLPLLVVFFKLTGGIHHPMLFLFAMVAGGELGLGLLERYIRKRAMARLEDAERKALTQSQQAMSMPSTCKLGREDDGSP